MLYFIVFLFLSLNLSSSLFAAAAGAGLSTPERLSRSMASSLVDERTREADLWRRALAGDVGSYYELGHCYRKKAETVDPRQKQACLKQAFLGYLQAAEKEHAKAAKALSRLPVDLERNDFTEKIITRAMKVWTKYATQDRKPDPDAQFRLGIEYMRGEWVAFNWGESIYWLGKAAEQGYGNAQQIRDTILKTKNFGRGLGKELRLDIKMQYPPIDEDEA